MRELRSLHYTGALIAFDSAADIVKSLSIGTPKHAQLLFPSLSAPNLLAPPSRFMRAAAAGDDDVASSVWPKSEEVF
jgi:hypothetical protein